MDVIDQVVSIFAGSKGLLDDLTNADVAAFEEGLLQHMKTAGKAIRDELAEQRKLSSDLEKKLLDEIMVYKEQFKASRG